MYIDQQDLKNLKDARDIVIQIKSMLKAKKDIIHRNIAFVDIANIYISEIIYKLTGEEFYKPKSGGN